MMTTATHNGHYDATAPVLFVAFERSAQSWKLGCLIVASVGPGVMPVTCASY
jgi:hypothetical protein